ncbi:putative helicase MAGATAMA 3 [Drosera capensis]
MAIDQTTMMEEKASVAEFYKTVLQWDYFSLTEKNKGAADGSGLMEVKNTYDNVEDYLKTFEPLLLEEAKAQIKQMNEDEEGILVVQQKHGVIKNWSSDKNESNGFCFPVVYYESEEGEKISQNDLLIVSNEKFELKTKPSTYAFALAEDRQKVSLRLRMYFPKDVHGDSADSKRLVNMRILVSGEDKVVYISKVCSLSTISREFVALRSIHTLPFKDVILRADDSNASSACNPWNIRASLTEFIESNHNASQLQAIRAGLSRRSIVLIQGPPGTGKTQTILGLLSAILHASPARTHDKDQQCSSRRVLELSKKETFRSFALASPWLTGNNPRDIIMPVNGDDGFYPVTGNELKPDIVIGSRKYRVRVLVCAPSNSALDEIVLFTFSSPDCCKGIQDENGRAYSPKIVRIGLKPHHSVQTVSIDHLVERKRGGMEEQKQGAYTKNTDSIRTSILEESVIVFSTLSFTGTISAKMKHGFDVVIIDEAAQAVEPSILVPLMNGCKQVLMGGITLVLFWKVGDPSQLPATVISEVAKNSGYGLSLFTRFQKAGYPVVMLQHQYRMHPEIREFPSRQFYADKLVDGPDVEEQTKRAWHDFRCFGPFCFFDVHEEVSRQISGTQVERKTCYDITI